MKKAKTMILIEYSGIYQLFVIKDSMLRKINEK